METTNNIIKVKSELYATMSNCINAVKDYVKEKGGFIDTHNGIYTNDGEELNDTMYGYALNENAVLTEYYIYGLKIGLFGDLECYLVPIANTYYLKMTKEEMMADVNHWYSFCDDDFLYSWQTIIGIMESIEQY